MRFLVVDGYTASGREDHRRIYGLTPSASYARVIETIEPAARCDIACPADEGANLPDPAGLASYDAVFLTGSSLHIYEIAPAVTRQIDLMRAVYASGVPSFGSCWGLQVGTVAAGGAVTANPNGREVGFARNIAPTAHGRAHPLLAGRPAAYDAPAIHLDAVATLPEGATVLASNGFSPVQAAEIAHDGGTFWGVQYHPEFDLVEVAAILGRIAAVLVREGFCRSDAEARDYAKGLKTLSEDRGRADLAWRYALDAEVLDAERRTREIRNFIAHQVKPEMSRRGRV